MIRVSSGTASVMGFKQSRVDDAPTTAYLMVGERCAYDCSFCPQARGSSSRAGFLSRVTWPELDEEAVVGAFVNLALLGVFRRGCIQVVHSRGVLERAERLVSRIAREWRRAGGTGGPPLSVSVHLAGLHEAGRLLDAGAQRLGLPVDAATREAYTRVKGGSWDAAVEAVLGVAAAHPGRVATHLIVGLGETEDEMVRAIQMMYDHGVGVGLFAFTPVRGTAMAGARPPSLDSYRRVQVAHYLIRRGISRAEGMSFEEGRLVGFGVDAGPLVDLLKRGEAFVTTGCPGCNRPYYNERPGGVMYNYPRELTPDEAGRALRDAIAGMAETGDGEEVVAG